MLIVVTDDMRADALAVMDFTNGWFKNGTRYTQAFATTPLCCPARASIFTGLYAHNHGVRKNQDSHDLDTSTTIQAHLQDNGYTTAMVGKYLNSWSVEEDPPHFDRWALYAGRYYGKPFNVDGQITPTDEYSTYHMAKRAKRFIRDFESDDDRPWFLYVATEAPHSPFTIPPQYKAAPVPDRPPSPARVEVSEADLYDKPPIPRRPFSLEKPEVLRKKQLRMLMPVDDLIQKVAATLRATEEDDDTLVVFLSDQGLLQGEHGLFAKRLPYTESIQIPLLLRWPGRELPETSDEIVANIDIAPTIRDLAGIPPDEMPVDGISLFSEVERSALLLEQPENWRIGLPDWFSLRTSDFQYNEYYGRSGGFLYGEYYDLVNDPYQLENLLGDRTRSNDPNVDGLTQDIRSLKNCRGEECVIAE